MNRVVVLSGLTPQRILKRPKVKRRGSTQNTKQSISRLTGTHKLDSYLRWNNWVTRRKRVNLVAVDESEGSGTMVGSYVRKIMAPNAHMGTITDTRTRKGRVEYLFHQDSRFDDVMSDIWLRESAIEPCSRPKDDEVDTINAFKRRSFWFWLMTRVPNVQRNSGLIEPLIIRLPLPIDGKT